MIFSWLKALGTDWIYHFPELGIVELPLRDDDPAPSVPAYSVSECAIAGSMRSVVARTFRSLGAELEKMNAHARDEALDREPQ